MKHKVSDLEGLLLDAAVAKAGGNFGQFGVDDAGEFQPSILWQHGGPIIERERIKLHPPETRRPGINWEWQADCYGAIDSAGEHYTTEEGSTPLIAAMRAYAASNFGEEVDLP